MPRIIPLNEVLQMEKDEPIICTQGRLTKVFRPKTGSNDRGTWSIQNATIERDGTTIDLFLKDRDELPQAWKGRDIVISARKGEKGWSGVYAMDDDYKGNVTRKIKVTPTGEIALLEGEGDGAEEPPPRTQQPKAPPTQQQPTQQQPREPAPPTQQTAPPKSHIAECVETLTQVANLQLMCLNLVADYVAPRYKAKTGIDMPTIDQHAWAMNLCIQGERIGLHTRMPVQRATTPPHAAAPQPQAPPPRPAGFPEDAQWDAASGQWIDTDGNILF